MIRCGICVALPGNRLPIPPDPREADAELQRERRERETRDRRSRLTAGVKTDVAPMTKPVPVIVLPGLLRPEPNRGPRQWVGPRQALRAKRPGCAWLRSRRQSVAPLPRPPARFQGRTRKDVTGTGRITSKG